MPISSRPVFPSVSLPGIGLPAVRRCLWRTKVQDSIGGGETRLQFWSYPRYSYTLTLEFLRAAAAYGEMQALVGFYNQVGGSAQVFQYTDPDDKDVPAHQVFATGAQVTGAQTAFQLVRTFGGFVEPVFAVDTVTEVRINGIAQGGGLYSVSDKGIITFNNAPPAGASLDWTGTFNWFCRFDADGYDFSKWTAARDFQGPLWELKKLTFTTIKFGS